MSLRALGSSLTLVPIEPPTRVRGGVPPLSLRALGSSLTLVLIEPPTRVRGGVPPLSLRALGSSLTLVLIEPPTRVRGAGFAGTFPALPQARQPACPVRSRTYRIRQE